MVKIRTNMSIDEDIKIEAKKKGLNISEIAEEAISKQLFKVKVEIDYNLKKCDVCEKIGLKETPEEARRKNNRHEGMTWLWPDERWVCNSCLKRKVANY